MSHSDFCPLLFINSVSYYVEYVSLMINVVIPSFEDFGLTILTKYVFVYYLKNNAFYECHSS